MLVELTQRAWNNALGKHVLALPKLDQGNQNSLEYCLRCLFSIRYKYFKGAIQEPTIHFKIVLTYTSTLALLVPISYVLMIRRLKHEKGCG